MSSNILRIKDVEGAEIRSRLSRKDGGGGGEVG